MSDQRAGFLSRAWAAFVLALIFIRELALSSILVARTAFARNIDVRPAIIAVPLDLKTDLGVALVANLVSLTPGTTSLHTSQDGKILYVHALDAMDDEAVIASIKNAFEHWVRKLEGTR
jgi:multicomponent Na+:H+ antiporter subunit E